MRPVLQSKLGPGGDCFRACVASLLGLELLAVPDFMLGLPPWAEDEDSRVAWQEAFRASVDAFLAPLGLCYFEVSFQVPIGDFHLRPPSGLWIGVGRVPGSACDHAVVMRGGELAHDPALFSAPPVIFSVGVVLPLGGPA